MRELKGSRCAIVDLLFLEGLPELTGDVEKSLILSD